MLESFETGIWSVGLYRGPSLDKLAPCSQGNPIVTGRNFGLADAVAMADPFAIQKNGVWHLFFEVFFRSNKIAAIGAVRSENLVDWVSCGIVLRQPHHLSYPFVFEHDGEIYMMPESKSVRRVDIFRAVDFPTKWVFEKTILRGRYMDCSMVYYGDRYWLFAGWRSYFLRLFHAKHPLGPWTAHWLPSIRHYSKSSTRPGGRPIITDGQLVRFSQDNKDYYGQQLRAWRVTAMNRLWYSEAPLFEQPILKGTGSGWNARCMHHIDAFEMPESERSSEFIAFVDGSA